MSIALSILEKAEREAKQNETVKEIKLLASCNRRIVTECIEIFRKNHKDVAFSIAHKTEQSPYDFDMIVSDTKLKGAANEILLVTEQFKLAFSKNHPLAEKEVILPCDLEHEKFIAMQKGSSQQSITEMLCGRQGFVPDIAIEIDDPYYIRKYIEMGLGISFVPTVSWKGMLSENVLFKSVEGMEYERKTYLIFPKPLSGKHYAEFTETLLDKLKEQLS